jgi:hypothetical protein
VSVNTNPRTRNAVAVLCIALVVFAAFIPATATDLAPAVLVPLWLIAPAVAVTVIRRRARRCADRAVALLSLVLFRAPPHALPLA